MRLFALLLSAVLALVPSSSQSVSVAYAGSLVATMEGPLARTLRERTGLTFSGEAKGSKALANLIKAGLRTPDVFITADPKLLTGLPIASSVIFGSARMVVGYSPKSPHARLFDEAAAGRRPILDLLAAPSVRTGRTDPALDPKGERTIRVLRLLGEHYHQPDEAREVLAHAGAFPEEDLAVRVESGDLDAGFFYSTEVRGRGLRTVELPDDSNLSSEITYAIAPLRAAPHPQAARTFIDFILNGRGKRILEEAGLRFFAHPVQRTLSSSP